MRVVWGVRSILIYIFNYTHSILLERSWSQTWLKDQTVYPCSEQVACESPTPQTLKRKSLKKHIILPRAKLFPKLSPQHLFNKNKNIIIIYYMLYISTPPQKKKKTTFPASSLHAPTSTSVASPPTPPLRAWPVRARADPPVQHGAATPCPRMPPWQRATSSGGPWVVWQVTRRSRLATFPTGWVGKTTKGRGDW